ncbi:MAG: hypothetical protein IJ357_04145 [Oscillospiraceae bacterium]|nr:hypothetical protein [Oscillospiraceae bacterium]
MRYELIREIFNQCSNNQMRDVFVSEVETEDTDAVARKFCTGQSFTIEKTCRADGAIIYDLVVDGLRQRLSFTPDD